MNHARITALRAASAKLAEALAVPALDFDIASHLAAYAADLFPYDDDAPESSALYLCADKTEIIDNPKGWAYIVRALRLRMLAEALLLEQGATPTGVRYGQHLRDGRDVRDEDLGALVRAELARQATGRG